MNNTHNRLHGMILCALFAALTAVCSQIAVPMPWGVPINFALFSVYLAGALCGPWLGAASQLVYLALAAVGVPVMAGLVGGPALLFGRTGGYMVGYILAAGLTGLLCRAWGNATLPLCAAMAIGCAGCYALGTLWFMALTGTGLLQSLAWCVLPYLPGDAVKILLAALVTQRLARVVKL